MLLLNHSSIDSDVYSIVFVVPVACSFLAKTNKEQLIKTRGCVNLVGYLKVVWNHIFIAYSCSTLI